MPINNNLAGMVAIVTGSAQGIGAAIAEELAARGANVVLTDINSAAAAERAAAISQDGPEAISVHHDAAEAADWETVAKAAIDKFGKVDILVNNAALLDVTPFSEMSEEKFNRVMGVNVTGTFLGAKTIVPLMEKNGGGSIINMSSIDGMVSHVPGLTAYATSKGAVRLFTKALAVEVAGKNIRVNSVHPGVIGTPSVQPFLKDTTRHPDILKRTAMQRVGEPSEIAKVVAFLASADSSFMTGSEVVADGGLLSS